MASFFIACAAVSRASNEASWSQRGRVQGVARAELEPRRVGPFHFDSRRSEALRLVRTAFTLNEAELS